jgi:hypothetical protein
MAQSAQPKYRRRHGHRYRASTRQHTVFGATVYQNSATKARAHKSRASATSACGPMLTIGQQHGGKEHFAQTNV